MARIDWTVLCDLAFFDRQDRLCVIGLVDRLPAPSLPLAISQMTLVARLSDVQMVDEFGVSIAIVAPGGTIISPNDCVVEMVQQYLLVTLRSVPLQEEGVYRFGLAITGQEPVFAEVPVLSLAPRPAAGLH